LEVQQNLFGFKVTCPSPANFNYVRNIPIQLHGLSYKFQSSSSNKSNGIMVKARKGDQDTVITTLVKEFGANQVALGEMHYRSVFTGKYWVHMPQMPRLSKKGKGFARPGGEDRSGISFFYPPRSDVCNVCEKPLPTAVDSATKKSPTAKFKTWISNVINQDGDDPDQLDDHILIETMTRSAKLHRRKKRERSEFTNDNEEDLASKKLKTLAIDEHTGDPSRKISIKASKQSQPANGRSDDNLYHADDSDADEEEVEDQDTSESRKWKVKLSLKTPRMTETTMISPMGRGVVYSMTSATTRKDAPMHSMVKFLLK
jgi:hypothetical protein